MSVFVAGFSVKIVFSHIPFACRHFHNCLVHWNLDHFTCVLEPQAFTPQYNGPITKVVPFDGKIKANTNKPIIPKIYIDNVIYVTDFHADFNHLDRSLTASKTNKKLCIFC